MSEDIIKEIKDLIDNDKELTISDLKDIKEYINSKIDTLNSKLCDLPMDNKKYDISFLKSYLNIKGISVNNLAKSLDINRSYAYKLLNGNMFANSKQLVKVLVLLNVRTYEELIMLVEKNKNEYYTATIENNIDLNQLKSFLIKNRISNVRFAEYLGIKKAHLYRIFNGKIEIKPKYLNKIFILLDSDELAKELSKKKSKKTN